MQFYFPSNLNGFWWFLFLRIIHWKSLQVFGLLLKIYPNHKAFFSSNVTSFHLSLFQESLCFYWEIWFVLEKKLLNYLIQNTCFWKSYSLPTRTAGGNTTPLRNFIFKEFKKIQRNEKCCSANASKQHQFRNNVILTAKFNSISIHLPRTLLHHIA